MSPRISERTVTWYYKELIVLEMGREWSMFHINYLTHIRSFFGKQEIVIFISIKAHINVRHIIK